MTGQLILPPEYKEIEGPVVFLAGPIQGAPDWQSEAIEWFQANTPHLNIASPRREYLEGTFDYAAQVDWETFHLNLAAKTGVVMFFLAKEAVHVEGRAYAQTSRFELGEWKAKHEQTGCKLVLGIDKEFTNSRYIRRRFAQDCPNAPIYDTLEEVCKQIKAWV